MKNSPLSSPFGVPAVIPVLAEIGTSLSVAFQFRLKGENPFRSYTSWVDSDAASVMPMCNHFITNIYRVPHLLVDWVGLT